MATHRRLQEHGVLGLESNSSGLRCSNKFEALGSEIDETATSSGDLPVLHVRRRFSRSGIEEAAIGSANIQAKQNKESLCRRCLHEHDTSNFEPSGSKIEETAIGFADIAAFKNKVTLRGYFPPWSDDLTWEATKLNAENDTGRKSILVGHLALIESHIKTNPDICELWCRRKILVKELGIDANKGNELDFTEKIISVDSKNTYAWSYRQWVLQAFEGWENELAFCNKVLGADIYNEFAWNQRFFVVTRFNRGAGCAEIDYAIRAISRDPENEHSWVYLRSLYKNFKVDSEELAELFDSIFESEGFIIMYRLDKTARAHDIEIGIIKNRRKLIYALDALLDLISCGYIPSGSIEYRIGCISPTIAGNIRIFDGIYSILELACPMDAEYWKWRVNKAEQVHSANNIW